MGSSNSKEQLGGLELSTVCASLLIVFTITELQTVLSSLMLHRNQAGNFWHISMVIQGFHQQTELVPVFSFPFPFLFSELKV